jgi:hypothetical protein
VPSVWEYAAQLAAADTGWWRSSTRRAADLLAPQHPIISLPRMLPLQQVLVQTTALLVYAISRSQGADPTAVTGNQMAGWVADRAVPLPPDPDSSDQDEWTTTVQRWLTAMPAAVQRQQDDLAFLLRRAGHEVPAAGARSLSRHSPDPVIAQWLDLVDRDMDAATYGYNGGYTGPLLTFGLASITDTFGPGLLP